MAAKLYVVPGSQPSRACKWYLKLAGIPADKVEVVTLTFEEFVGPKVGEVNPLYWSLPALHLADGTILTESGAILCYMAEEYADNKLVPQSALASYKHTEALLHHDTLSRNVSRLNMFPVVQGAMMKRPLADSKAIVAGNCEEFNYHLGTLDKILATNQFIAGDEMTVADLLVQCELHQIPLAKDCILSADFSMDKFPNVQRYMAAMEQVEGHAESVAEAKMLVGFATSAPATEAAAPPKHSDPTAAVGQKEEKQKRNHDAEKQSEARRAEEERLRREEAKREEDRRQRQQDEEKRRNQQQQERSEQPQTEYTPLRQTTTTNNSSKQKKQGCGCSLM